MKYKEKQQLEELIKEVYTEIKFINSHKILQVYNSMYKLLAFQFMKGLAFGLGSVAGATIVVSILLYFLSQIELIPIVGDWVKHIMHEIKKN